MLDIVKGSLVYYGGRKFPVLGVSESEVKLKCWTDWGIVPKADVKPVVRLTPLVRARMALDWWRKTPICTRAGRKSPTIWNANLVLNAHSFIESIGGYDAAKLYTDCDGIVNGRFIRGDDVRRALKLLGVI